MRNSVKIAILGLAVAGLSGCGGMELGKARSVDPKGSAFDVNLYAEYLTLSGMEFDEADYKDSDTFAMRAISAGSAASPAPEDIKARNLPQNAVYDLTVARDRLVAALGKGGAEKAPMPAARAQAMYECWMQEQEENFQPKDIAACRAEFDVAIAKLEEAVKPPMMAKPAPAPTPMPVKQPDPTAFMVFFEFDSTALTATGKKIVADAVMAIKKTNTKSVAVAGYADRAGPVTYNLQLSQHRVATVVAALKAAGLPGGTTVNSASYGEGSPRIETKDGERAAGNRRVQIVLNP